MPRSSWSSRSSKPAVSRTVSRPVTSPVPANTKVEQPGFFSNIWQGFGFGAGQAVAHNIFRSDPVVTHVHDNGSAAATVPMNELPKEFVQCMKDNHNDTDLCKQFIK